MHLSDCYTASLLRELLVLCAAGDQGRLPAACSSTLLEVYFETCTDVDGLKENRKLAQT